MGRGTEPSCPWDNMTTLDFAKLRNSRRETPTRVNVVAERPKRSVRGRGQSRTAVGEDVHAQVGEDARALKLQDEVGMEFVPDSGIGSPEDVEAAQVCSVQHAPPTCTTPECHAETVKLKENEFHCNGDALTYDTAWNTIIDAR